MSASNACYRGQLMPNHRINGGAVVARIRTALALTLRMAARSVPHHPSRRQSMSSRKGTLAILTGGGDVPGLNPAIRAITIRALREGYRVIGIRRGWAGLVDYERDESADNGDNVQLLSEA